MKVSPRRYALLVCLSCSLILGSVIPGSAAAQQPAAVPPAAAPPSQEAPAQKPNNRRVILDVIVTSKSGQPVRGLQKQDFSILDNKKPTEATGFAAIDAAAQAGLPGQTIILLDEVNTTFTQVSRARDQIEDFLRKNHDELTQPVALAFLSDTVGVQLASEPTSNVDTLIGELRAHDAALRDIRRSAGFYGAVERFQLSLRSLRGIAQHEAGIPGRKTLVWISPGWPILSGPNIQLSAKDEEGLFNSLVDLTGLLQRARITLYSVDPLGTADAGGLRTFYYENFLKGVEASRQVQAGNLALQVLATHTGGRVFSGSNDIASEIAACVAESKTWYILSFNAPDDDPPNRWHTVQVNVDHPDLKVRTSAGYYAHP